MSGGTPQLPEPNFDAVMQIVGGPALLHLGVVANPVSGRIEKNIDLARLHIDLLQVLERKTRGNLTAAESGRLDGFLHQLHDMFLKARG